MGSVSDRAIVHTGDVTRVLRRFPPGFFDACLSDPPYGLSFMGKAWDRGVPSALVWRAILRTLRPGASIFAFGGTRTYHRLVCAMEEAGCEIRDQLDWLYGQGFAKSLDVQRAISMYLCEGQGRHFMTTLPRRTRAGDHLCPDHPDSMRFKGWQTALQPAHEPICFASKPIGGTFAWNAFAIGVGGLNIEGSRIAELRNKPILHTRSATGTGEFTYEGRWPKNVILSHAPDCRPLGDRKVKAPPAWNDNRGPSAFTGEQTSPVHHADPDGTETVEVWDCVPGCIVRQLDEQSGLLKTASGGSRSSMGFSGGRCERTPIARPTDAGGASRFFKACSFEPRELAEFFAYVAKASRFERDFGCERLRLRSAPETVDRDEGSSGMESPRAGAGRTTGARNHHPTVKPIKLTEYLARMQLPPPREDGAPRRLLVPFSGVCSEVIGALRAGWDEVHGIEIDPEYVEIGEARIERWLEVRPELEPDDIESAGVVAPEQGALAFDRPLTTERTRRKRGKATQ
jgi:hypothetical protein